MGILEKIYNKPPSIATSGLPSTVNKEKNGRFALSAMLKQYLLPSSINRYVLTSSIKVSIYSLFGMPSMLLVGYGSSILSVIFKQYLLPSSIKTSCNLSAILIAPLAQNQMLIIGYGSSKLSVLMDKYNQQERTGKFNQEVLTAKFNQEESQSFLYSSLWLTIKC